MLQRLKTPGAFASVGHVLDDMTLTVGKVMLSPIHYLHRRLAGKTPQRPVQEPGMCAFFPAVAFSAGVGNAMNGNLATFFPQAVAVLFPSKAGQLSLVMIAMATAGGGLTVPLGEMADRDRGFLRPIFVAYAVMLASLCVYYALFLLHTNRECLNGNLASFLPQTVAHLDAGEDEGVEVLVIFSINTILFGWSTMGLSTIGMSMAGVYGMAFPHKASTFTAVSTFASMFMSMVVIGVMGSFPLLEGEYTVVLFMGGVAIVALLALVLFVPRGVFQPYDLLPDEEKQAITDPTKKASILAAYWDATRDFCTGAYRPMMLVMLAITTMFFVMGVESNLVLYLLEDLTPLGLVPGKAVEFNANVMTVATLVSMLVVIPAGNWIDKKVKRPVRMFAWLFLPTGISFFSLIYSSVSINFAFPALFAMVLIPAINILFSVPALISCVVKPNNFARDLNFVFGIAGFVPAPIMVLASPILASFGEVPFEGRDRPRYTYSGYLTLLILCAFVIGVGMVTACVADSIVEKRGRQALI